MKFDNGISNSLVLFMFFFSCLLLPFIAQFSRLILYSKTIDLIDWSIDRSLFILFIKDFGQYFKCFPNIFLSFLSFFRLPINFKLKISSPLRYKRTRNSKKTGPRPSQSAPSGKMIVSRNRTVPMRDGTISGHF